MGPVRSFREHLSRLEAAGRLSRPKQALRLDALPTAMAASSGATLVGVEGFNYPIAFNTLGDAEEAAIAAGVPPASFRGYFLERADNPLRQPKLSELDMKGPISPDLGIFPVPKYYQLDAGPYLTSSIVFVAGPGPGSAVFNASVHRIRVLGPRRGVIRMVENRHLHRMFTEARRAGRELNVVVEVGANPLVELAAAYQAPFEVYEGWVANSLAGGSMRFTEVSGIPVPLGCEVLLEGRILPAEEDVDVMTDMLGIYDKERMQPLIEFDSMYVDPDGPIFRGLLPGGQEHRFLMSFPVEAKMESQLKSLVPGVKRVVLTEGGGRWLHAVVQMDKRFEADPRTAILGAFTYHRSLKMVVVVDGDIDPEDPEEVEFAMATRFQPDRGLIVLSGMRGSTLDPSSDQSRLLTAKWGIDATAPLGEGERFRRAELVRPRGEAVG